MTFESKLASAFSQKKKKLRPGRVMTQGFRPEV